MVSSKIQVRVQRARSEGPALRGRRWAQAGPTVGRARAQEARISCDGNKGTEGGCGHRGRCHGGATEVPQETGSTRLAGGEERGRRTGSRAVALSGRKRSSAPAPMARVSLESGRAANRHSTSDTGVVQQAPCDVPVCPRQRS